MAKKGRKAELLIYTGNKDWYYTPYLRDENGSAKVGWDPSLFQLPCKCCGSPHHGLFHHKLDRLGAYEEAKISCPVVSFNNVYDLLCEMLMSRKYRPDPHRLATYLNHNPEEIPVAIEQIRKQGAGRHMFPEQLNKLETETTQICFNVRSTWTFKRETRELGEDYY